MIYFVLDSHSLAPFAEGMGAYARKVSDRIRLIEYSQLGVLGHLPLGTYVFMDRYNSEPARLALAQIAAQKLRDAGACVMNMPMEVGPPIVSWRLGEDVEAIRFPVVLRRRESFLVLESLPMHTKEELLEAAAVALLEGYDPRQITAHSAHMDEVHAGAPIQSLVRVGSRVFRYGNGSETHCVEADSFEPGLQVGRLEIASMDGGLKVWRCDDGPRSIWPELAGAEGRKCAALIEEGLQELDTNMDGSVCVSLAADKVRESYHSSVK